MITPEVADSATPISSSADDTDDRSRNVDRPRTTTEADAERYNDASSVVDRPSGTATARSTVVAKPVIEKLTS